MFLNAKLGEAGPIDVGARATPDFAPESPDEIGSGRTMAWAASASARRRSCSEAEVEHVFLTDNASPARLVITELLLSAGDVSAPGVLVRPRESTASGLYHSSSNQTLSGERLNGEAQTHGAN
jgi:hypothetical protein